MASPSCQPNGGTLRKHVQQSVESLPGFPRNLKTEILEHTRDNWPTAGSVMVEMRRASW